MNARGGAVFLLLLLPAAWLSSCAMPVWLPEHFATAKEAFPDKESMVPPREKADSSETAIFAVSYEDVYRAALVSASQALLDVTEENKHGGYILADKIEQGAHWLHWYYAIRIDEIGAKRSRVTIAVKLQGGCLYAGLEKDCLELSQVHWGIATATTKQMMAFIRNNLIAAGLY